MLTAKDLSKDEYKRYKLAWSIHQPLSTKVNLLGLFVVMLIANISYMVLWFKGNDIDISFTVACIVSIVMYIGYGWVLNRKFENDLNIALYIIDHIGKMDKEGYNGADDRNKRQ